MGLRRTVSTKITTIIDDHDVSKGDVVNFVAVVVVVAPVGAFIVTAGWRLETGN